MCGIYQRLYWENRTLIKSAAAGLEIDPQRPPAKRSQLAEQPALVKVGQRIVQRQPELAGLVAAFAGMLLGSILPQVLKNRHEPRGREAIGV